MVSEKGCRIDRSSDIAIFLNAKIAKSNRRKDRQDIACVELAVQAGKRLDSRGIALAPRSV